MSELISTETDTAADGWQTRVCVFWYIVLADLALHLFLNNSMPAFLVITGMRDILGVNADSWTQVQLDSFSRGVKLWVVVLTRAFEFGVILHWLGRPARSVLSEFGFRKDCAGRGMIAGLATAAVLGGGFFLCQVVVSWWADRSLVAELGLAGRSAFERESFYQFSFISAGCVSAAFFEDVIFVGLLFGALRKRFPLPGAFALALGHFIAAHVVINLLLGGDPSKFLEMLQQNQMEVLRWVLGGAAFLTLYAVFKSLIPSMIVHCVGNLLIFYSGIWFD